MGLGFVRDSKHEQDGRLIFHYHPVAHFHDEPAMRGFLLLGDSRHAVVTQR